MLLYMSYTNRKYIIELSLKLLRIGFYEYLLDILQQLTFMYLYLKTNNVALI